MIQVSETDIREHLNCPNCGAPIDSNKCPYCGCVFMDFGELELDKPQWMRIKLNGKHYMIRVMPMEFSIHYTPPDTYALYADDKVINHCISGHGTTEFDLRMISYDDLPIHMVVADQGHWAITEVSLDDSIHVKRRNLI